MSGLGDGARNRGDRRPRVACPVCKRSTAVTFNKETGERYLRSHKKPGGPGSYYKPWCAASKRAVGPHVPYVNEHPKETKHG